MNEPILYPKWEGLWGHENKGKKYLKELKVAWVRTKYAERTHVDLLRATFTLISF